MDLRIVDVEERHIPQLVELERQCFSMPWTAEQLRGQMKDKLHEFIAAEAMDGAILGYVGMTYVIDEGYISNVAAAPANRRQGIGSRLVEALLKRAEELELAFVTLEVRESNEAAIELYKKYGFSQVGLRKNYYDLPKENAILMTKFLK